MSQDQVITDLLRKVHLLGRVVGSKFRLPADGASMDDRLSAVSSGLDEIIKAFTDTEPHTPTEHVQADPKLASQAREAKLEKLLGQRPSRSELVDRGVLPDSKVAPGLAAAQHELAKHRLSDKLDRFLERRPNSQELVDRHILWADDKVQPSLLQKQHDLQHAIVTDQLEKALEHRPDRETLVARNVLPAEDSPAQHESAKAELAAHLQARPDRSELVDKKILQ
eukprot:TRINITY_DN3330_c0_g1_i2.p2 TRINITY_DN3330_c0_g1~~TRINITY_DN3330_c0_g1_i2.p2  ORF type:complete len:224 (+),score=50.49 TRINITY_DN3330_c0_g1_i2:103-774(+)